MIHCRNPGHRTAGTLTLSFGTPLLVNLGRTTHAQDASRTRRHASPNLALAAVLEGGAVDCERLRFVIVGKEFGRDAPLPLRSGEEKEPHG